MMPNISYEEVTGAEFCTPSNATPTSLFLISQLQAYVRLMMYWVEFQSEMATNNSLQTPR